MFARDPTLVSRLGNEPVGKTEVSRGPWAVVLAAGEGRRLRAVTNDRRGRSTPKQFCSLNGGGSLLQLAFRRAASVAPSRRITTIVAAQHEAWWRAETARMPAANVVVQPENRGTAIGVLTPLLCIYAQDPNAQIVLMPSDHFVADESVLARVLHEAVIHAAWKPDRVVLLGIVPDEPDTGFGWIVPATTGGNGPQRVSRFVEKPAPPVAEELMRNGGLWNSFILAAGARTLLDLFDRSMPHDVAALWGALSRDLDVAQRPDDLARTYAGLGRHDFCRDVLEGVEDRLAVLPVPGCGWSDLGTPERLTRCIEHLPRTEPVTHDSAAGPMDLVHLTELMWAATSACRP